MTRRSVTSNKSTSSKPHPTNPKVKLADLFLTPPSLSFSVFLSIGLIYLFFLIFVTFVRCSFNLRFEDVSDVIIVFFLSFNVLYVSFSFLFTVLPILSFAFRPLYTPGWRIVTWTSKNSFSVPHPYTTSFLLIFTIRTRTRPLPPI